VFTVEWTVTTYSYRAPGWGRNAIRTPPPPHATTSAKRAARSDNTRDRVWARPRDVTGGEGTVRPMASPDRVAALVEPFVRRPDRAAVVTDFDGTLAPIVADPAAARPLPEVPDLLRRL